MLNVEVARLNDLSERASDSALRLLALRGEGRLTRKRTCSLVEQHGRRQANEISPLPAGASVQGDLPRPGWTPALQELRYQRARFPMAAG